MDHLIRKNKKKLLFDVCVLIISKWQNWFPHYEFASICEPDEAPLKGMEGQRSPFLYI